MMREKLSALTMVAIAATGISIVACGGNLGDNNTATPCTFDDECDIGQFCDQDAGVCVEPCTSNSDCSVGEECVERTSTDTTKVCRPSTSSNNPMSNNPVGCTDNEECGADQVCLDGTCMDLSSNNTNNPIPQYFVVQILDESSGAGSCESKTNGEGDPGSDIMFVRLLDDQGQVIGFGEQLSYDATDNDTPNGFISASHIDGNAPDIDDSSCPIDNGGRFRADSILALGCGGHLLTRFLDMSMNPVPLLAGYQIEVGEYDAECNKSGNMGSDRYSVYLCEDTAAASSGSTGSCSRELGSNQVGISSSTVSLP